MSDEDSRASTSSSSSSSSTHQQQQQEANPPKKRDSKASMSKTSKHLSTSAKRWVQWVEWVEWESSTGACDVTPDKLAGGKFVAVFAEQLRSSLWTRSNILLTLIWFCRIQKELADITLDPPPNCRWVVCNTRLSDECFLFSITDFMICHKLVCQCTELFLVHVDVCVRERNKHNRLWANERLMSTS